MIHLQIFHYDSACFLRGRFRHPRDSTAFIVLYEAETKSFASVTNAEMRKEGKGTMRLKAPRASGCRFGVSMGGRRNAVGLLGRRKCTANYQCEPEGLILIYLSTL